MGAVAVVQMAKRFSLPRRTPPRERRDVFGPEVFAIARETQTTHRPELYDMRALTVTDHSNQVADPHAEEVAQRRPLVVRVSRNKMAPEKTTGKWRTWGGIEDPGEGSWAGRYTRWGIAWERKGKWEGIKVGGAKAARCFSRRPLLLACFPFCLYRVYLLRGASAGLFGVDDRIPGL